MDMRQFTLLSFEIMLLHIPTQEILVILCMCVCVIEVKILHVQQLKTCKQLSFLKKNVHCITYHD